ncbi:MAG: hypothetical protein OEW77_00975 [Gemmatimonadota bacterium]|nr:hypothetical protein [Gemmatimonadota bacterium]
MALPTELLELLRAHGESMMLSVYIEATPADPSERRRWRVRLRQGLQEARGALAEAPPAEAEAFARAESELLARLPASDDGPPPGGRVLFCAADGESVTITLPAGLDETQVSWGRGPRLVPYLRAAITEVALVLRLDLEHARLDRWTDGVLRPLVDLESDRPHDIGSHMGGPPRPGFHGGTRGRSGTDEEQRQRVDGQDRLRAAARTALIAHVGADEAVVLGGSPEATSRLFASLPTALSERTIVAPPLTLRAPDAAVPDLVRTALARLAAVRRLRRLEALREDAHAHGRAALGIESARAAAEASAIDELLFTERAWRRDPELIEGLVRRTLAEGGSVECATASSAGTLDDDADGVIAALRFPLAATR